jgi:tRNA (uracil-5-)-methyltransferase TRM9
LILVVNPAIIIPVNLQLVKQLVALNQSFYSRFANEFSETRSSAQTRLNRIVKYVPDRAAVLEIGCGNGRLAERLEREARPLTYLGVDAAPEMVQIANARRAALRFVQAQFQVADITAPGWNAGFSDAPFDLVVALAVLHHIPSVELRQAVLRDAHGVLKPGGTLVMTNWQFMNSERMRKKIEPWGTLGIDERELEDGDALLRWKRGGTAYRYCHWLSKVQVEELAAASGFAVVRQFFADADLNLYSVLRK